MDNIVDFYSINEGSIPSPPTKNNGRVANVGRRARLINSYSTVSIRQRNMGSIPISPTKSKYGETGKH